MAATRAPKMEKLSPNETLNSFLIWKDTLVYTLDLDPKFSPFLKAGVTWGDSDTENRGFLDDNEPIPEAERKTKGEKVRVLNLMLGQIANWCTIIARHQIVNESTSLDSIWSMIREHYGFHVTGSRFLDLSSIRMLPGEKPSDLYQRLVSFFTDNLFTKSSGLKHKGKDPISDEKLSVSLQNTIIVLWLEKLHTGLPGLVKQRYGTELRNKTLASIKSEISLALDSMLEGLRSTENTRVMRLQPSRPNNMQSNFQKRPNNPVQRPRDYSNPRICSLCKTANLPGFDTHFLSQCKYISERDRKLMARVRYTETEEEAEYDEVEETCDTIDNSLFIDNPNPSVLRRVTTRKSPHMSCFYNHYPAKICLDSGSESSLVSEKFAMTAGIPILPQSIRQGAVQADSSSQLDIIGEVKNVKIRRGPHVFNLDALVTRNDIGDIIAGEPFLELNDIALRPSKKQIIIKGNEIISYSSATDRL